MKKSAETEAGEDRAARSQTGCHRRKSDGAAREQQQNTGPSQVDAIEAGIPRANPLQLKREPDTEEKRQEPPEFARGERSREPQRDSIHGARPDLSGQVEVPHVDEKNSE